MESWLLSRFQLRPLGRAVVAFSLGLQDESGLVSIVGGRLDAGLYLVDLAVWPRVCGLSPVSSWEIVAAVVQLRCLYFNELEMVWILNYPTPLCDALLYHETNISIYHEGTYDRGELSYD